MIFEPHAVVWAEEPGTINGLWKQRLRWARGNLQVTRRFARVWFRMDKGHRLGSTRFGLFWFTLLLQPVFLICASASLVTLYYIDAPLAWDAFHALWIINVLTYVFITLFALLIDPGTGRRVWREAILFPGLVSLLIMLTVIIPGPLRYLTDHGLSLIGASGVRHYGAEFELFIYAWLAGSMLVAYLAKVAENHLPRRPGPSSAGRSSTSPATARCCARCRSPPTSSNCGTPRPPGTRPRRAGRWLSPYDAPGRNRRRDPPGHPLQARARGQDARRPRRRSDHRRDCACWWCSPAPSRLF